MSRNIITGIDAGSSIIRVIVAEKKKDGNINILSAVQKQSQGIRRGFVSDIESATKSISSAIRSAEKMAGLEIKNIILAVGGIGLNSIKSKGNIVISKPDNEITESEVNRVIEESEVNIANIINRKILHSFPLYFKVDNNLIWGRPEGMIGTKLEVETLFITCLNQHLSDLLRAVENSGVSIDSDNIIAAPLAMAETLLTQNQKDVGCVLANIGSTTVSIIVFEEGLPISLEVFPIGSSNITNDIALGFQVSLEEAEKMKLNYGKDNQPNKRKLEDIIKARLEDVFELIDNHLKKINREEMLPGGIILTGGGSNLFGIDEIAKAALHLPAKIGTFITTLENTPAIKIISANSNSIKEMVTNDPSWSTAIGLCLISQENDYSTNKRKSIFSGISKLFKNLMP